MRPSHTPEAESLRYRTAARYGRALLPGASGHDRKRAGELARRLACLTGRKREAVLDDLRDAWEEQS
jgi:hypothetical protein